MFRILIIEDNAEKLKNITKIIEEQCSISSDSIDNRIDAMSAKRLLRSTFYDLIIVDIAIPNRISENVNPEGGIELVLEILGRDIYHKPTHIIGLTAYSDTFEKAVDGFSSQVITVIKYSDTDEEWEKKLHAGISHWQHSKISSLVIKKDYNYDIAIITAVDIEFEAVKNLSSKWERLEFPNDAAIYYEGNFVDEYKSFRVILAKMSQMGMIASSALTMKMIYNFRPKYLFMPGIAASLKNRTDHGFGDVLVIDESWDGGAGKITKDEEGKYKFEKVALHLRVDKDISEKMRALQSDSGLLREIKDNFTGKSPNTELNIHIGSVVSVAGVIANEEASKELISHDRKLMGLEMEAYGVYYSATNCDNPKPIFLALKSVCDFADSSKDDDYQSYAAFTSAKVMQKFILLECEPLNT